MLMSAIIAKDLCKYYGDVKAVDSLNLDISAGSFFGLLGRNGSGKTTSLQMFSTLIRPTSGKVLVVGSDVVESPVEVRRNVGFVFQESALDGTMTVDENLKFAGALYGLSNAEVRDRSEQLLTLFDLMDKRNRKVLTLSGGMRRAVDIARGVLHRPAILLLDEPTIGLDIINRRAIWGYLNGLRKQGMTIVLTTHYMEEAADCNQVVFMKNGRVIGDGSPADLISQVGSYMLDIVTEQPESIISHLTPLLGKPVVQADLLQFRVRDEDFEIGALQDELRKKVRSLLFRQPDLNDVYVWTNKREQD